MTKLAGCINYVAILYIRYVYGMPKLSELLYVCNVSHLEGHSVLHNKETYWRSYILSAV